MTQYRHGLSFIRLPFDGRAELEKILRSLPPDARREEPAAPAPERDGVALRRGRLAQLRELAEAKRSEAKKPDRRDVSDAAISEALRTAYQYLKDLAEQLNVIHPSYAKTYAIPGVPDFKRLVWEAGMPISAPASRLRSSSTTTTSRCASSFRRARRSALRSSSRRARS
jgi:hypothetical protein